MTAEPTYGPDGPEYTIDVLGTHGNPIRVVLIPLARDRHDVRRGEIVFYDQRYAPWPLNGKVTSHDGNRTRDPEQGQCMGAYTLGGRMAFLDGREDHHGLCLDGGVPSWSIDGSEMIPLMKWVRRRCVVAGTDLSATAPVMEPRGFLSPAETREGIKGLHGVDIGPFLTETLTPGEGV